MFTKTSKIKFEIDVCVEDDDGRFHAYCPTLPGVHVDGETREQAVENVKVAIMLYIKSLISHNEPIPLKGTLVEESMQRPQFYCPPSRTESVLVTI